ncbi:GTP-binding protein [Pseudobutyrivibrio sp.]|nr:GTP-binding protein [Pseudobutyrivibrio sp.]
MKDDWDEKYGDRINQVVFIGKGYEKSQIVELVNNCIEKEYLA